MKIGITGGTGGLGTRLTELLVAKGMTVRALVRKTSNLGNLKKMKVEIFFGDLNDLDSIKEFVSGLDRCYHLAAEVVSVSREQLMKSNVEGTRNICEAIIDRNPSCRLIYCSSIAVKEVNQISKFYLSDYTMSKYFAKRVVNQYMKKGLLATIVYPGYIYGPYDKVIMPTLDTILKRGLPFLVKGGERDAPIVYVDDLCELFYLAGTSNVSVGKEYVSLRSSAVGIHGFLNLVADELGYPFPRLVLPKAPLIAYAVIAPRARKWLGKKSPSLVNMRLIGILSKRAILFCDDAKRDLGWDHKMSMEKGVKIAVEWYRSHRAVTAS